MALETWANLAEIVGAGGLLSGLVFGLFQIRQYGRRQREAVASNLTQTFYSHELAQALALLQQVPDGIGARELRALGDEYVAAAVTVATSFETMGLLVYKRIAPLDMVLDLAGGIITTMSRKLHNWQEEVRREQQQPSWGEWFEWLGDQAARVKNNQEPAHIRHRNWRP